MNLLGRFLEKTEFQDYNDFINNYKPIIPESFNFGYDVVDEYARVAPQKRALLHYDDNGDEPKITNYTFGDISRLSNKYANLFASLGLKKGDTVLCILRERAEVWIIITALIKLGVILIPATFQLAAEDIVYRCKSADVKMLCAVDDDFLLAGINEAVPECSCDLKVGIIGDNVPDNMLNLRELVKTMPDTLRRVPNKSEDPMLIYFTSGTTGMPKMIVHDFRLPIGHITTAKYWQHVEDDGRHFTYSDSGWAKFAWGKIFGQWISGTEIVAYDSDRFHADKLLRAIDTLKLTTFCAPPTIYRSFIAENIEKYDFSTIHHCCSAGEPLNPEVINKFKAATGHTIYEGFGQSETTVLLANFGWDDIKPGSMGKPAPIYDFQLRDADGHACEDGETGTIVIKNAVSDRPCGLFREYRNNPEAMAETWFDGVYSTRDMAWRDSDGYFWFEGRDDDVIKCSGYRIGPFEVESVLMTHPSVKECAVTAVPDELRGQVVKATIILHKGWQGSDELKKDIQSHFKKTTAPYKYPRVIEFVDELPKTPSGKIKRGEIKKRDALKYKAMMTKNK